MTTSLDLLKQMAGSPTSPTDATLQTLLDRHAVQVEGTLTIDTGGTTARSNVDGWLSAVLTDANGTALVPATADLAAGVWTFVTAPATPVTAKGVVADLSAAAADAWMLRLSVSNTWKGEFATMARDMVAYYRSRARASAVEATRDVR